MAMILIASQVITDITKVTEESKRIIADSNIVTYQHVELISKWINRLETTDKLTTSYEFKLFFRASLNDSNEILGGYNLLEWKSNGIYGNTKDSFIFSFSKDKISILYFKSCNEWEQFCNE
ncbi:carbohydrate-binding module family 13 protein [Rhizophagus irregularis DAOM 181602=DAOM 197198]|nr:carbohydrate-binding module family 13 protein [Rhizophagus irregularis DAOM 181602=DAOM 197198]